MHEDPEGNMSRLHMLPPDNRERPAPARTSAATALLTERCAASGRWLSLDQVTSPKVLLSFRCHGLRCQENHAAESQRRHTEALAGPRLCSRQRYTSLYIQ